jgi:sterol desaturase/sphingolipid hydroxylase (fatty acid hydroxylase superfamily)
LFYDLWFYASHILLHTKQLYGPVHSIHHEKTHPTWPDTYHGHWFEGPFQSAGFAVPFLAYPLFSSDMVLALLFVNARGMLRHDPRGTPIVGEHHLLHHRYPSVNYGEPWLDALFGTRLGATREYDSLK